MFDMPPDLPDAIIAEQCQSVFIQYVRPAPDKVRESIERMKKKAPEKGAATDFVTLREQAIEKGGQMLGAQAGLYWRYGKIRETLSDPEITHALDTAFDFSQTVTDHTVLLPVIEEAKDSLEVSSDGQTARRSSITWEIVRPARIVPITPTWRDYLWMKALSEQAKPKDPSASMMPVNDAEKLHWHDAICRGFKDGVRQASLIFSDNVSQMIRDYKGMLRFRRLIESRIVSEPKVIEGKLGVTMTESGSRVNIDDRMVRITAPARFTSAANWTPARTAPRLVGPQTINPPVIPVDVGVPR